MIDGLYPRLISSKIGTFSLVQLAKTCINLIYSYIICTALQVEPVVFITCSLNFFNFTFKPFYISFCIDPFGDICNLVTYDSFNCILIDIVFLCHCYER